MKAKIYGGYVTLEDRAKQLSEEDRSTLREIEHRCGEYTYHEESVDKLIRCGLAFWIGGEPFITNTGKRLLQVL